MDKIPTKAKIKQLKLEMEFRCKNAAYSVADFWNNNKEAIVVIAPIALGAVRMVTRTINKGLDVHEEQKLKDNRVYDRSVGQYWETKRKIKTSERLELEERKANGEKTGQILKSMGLLKY